MTNTGDWPLGNYALPNVHRDDESTACPPGFVQKYTSLINRQAAFFDLQLLPSSLGSYFLDLIGHNFSALNVHYCERIRPKQIHEEKEQEAEGGKSQIPTVTLPIKEDEALQWPKGTYCVFSTSSDNHCPPGTWRSLADINTTGEDHNYFYFVVISVAYGQKDEFRWKHRTVSRSVLIPGMFTSFVGKY